MPTYTITSVAGGTFSHTLNYSVADAQRIFDAWVFKMQSQPDGSNPPLTTQGFIDWMANNTARQFRSWIEQKEKVVTIPPPPDITSS